LDRWGTRGGGELLAADGQTLRREAGLEKRV